jgi:hypothetical protein
MKNNYRTSPVIYFSLLILFLLSSPWYLGAQSYKLSGLWISTFGHMNLKISRATVSGSYYDGKVEGMLKGNFSSNRQLLLGKWDEGDLRGEFLFKILPGGNAFSGRWWKANSTDAGEWIAVRLDTEALSGSVSAKDYEGEWDTNFGKMNLRVEGVNLTGSFKGRAGEGTIEGTVDEKANQLKVRWSDARFRGTVVLRLLKSKNGINGEWWYSDKTYGGVWYGVRFVETVGCISGNCDDSVGVYLRADGTRYQGEWDGGYYHGNGTVYSREGTVVNRGLWSHGVFQGTPISGDCKNGAGMLTLPNGDIYEGDFKDCELIGKGKIIYQNGDIYQGDVLKGVASGRGTYTWAKRGESYSGTFRNGSIHGKGVYTFRNGDQYEGRFLTGKRHGEGTYTWGNGDRFEGEWRNDSYDGRGTYFYENGDQYNGNFSKGLKADEGTYTFSNRRSLNAFWREDKIVRITKDSRADDNNASPANLIARKNKLVLDLATHYQTARTGFIVYKITDTAAASGPRAILTEASQSNLHLEYFIVYGPESITDGAIRTYLEYQAGIKPDDQYNFEKLINPENRIFQVLDRYRYSLSKSRIHTNGAYYSYKEEDIALKY